MSIRVTDAWILFRDRLSVIKKHSGKLTSGERRPSALYFSLDVGMYSMCMYYLALPGSKILREIYHKPSYVYPTNVVKFLLKILKIVIFPKSSLKKVHQ